LARGALPKVVISAAPPVKEAIASIGLLMRLKKPATLTRCCGAKYHSKRASALVRVESVRNGLPKNWRSDSVSK
jgi:hypothetical protein